MEFVRSDVGHLSSRLLCREGRSGSANTKEMLPPRLSRAGLPGQRPTENANSLEEGPASVGPLWLDGTQSSLSGYSGLLWGDLQAGELATSFLLYLSQHWDIGRCRVPCWVVSGWASGWTLAVIRRWVLGVEPRVMGFI